MAHSNSKDETLLAYIKNSGKVFPLGASEVVYLRQQGLSDQVITAMLEQRANVTPAGSQLAQAPQPSVWANSTPPPAEPVATQPAPAYPTAPAPAVYPQPTPVYSYPAYPYSYGPYWGYPAISFSFGWGGYYGGYYHGYHGGWGYHSGGHGGGHH
jgi:hypothetical protein